MVSAMAAVKPTSADVARFQETEIGLVPDDWIVKPLSSLADLYQPKTISANEFTRYGYPVYGANGVVGHYHSYNHETRQIAVTCRGSTCGTVNYTVERSWITGNSMVVNCDQNPDISKDFLYHCLKGSDLTVCITGTGQPQIVRTPLAAILLAVPKAMSEQQAIAEALSDADAFIESLEKLIAKKRAIRQCAMHELLTQQHDWIEVRLGNSAQLKARIGWQGLTTSEYLESGDYHLVTGTEFFDGFIDWDNCHYVDKARYDQDKYIQIRNNDVLVTKDGTIGKVAFVDNLPLPATLNSGVFVIRPLANAFHPKFFYYLLMSPIFSEFLAKLSAGSTISHLYQKDFVKFSFFVPPTEQQQENIASTLMDMDRDIRATEARLTQMQQMKQGMMQELLTGRVRLV
jgi:type I restriction enzyme S subunit